MRATQLLGAGVFDRDGQSVGAVRDLVFEARGPHIVDSGQPAYRLTALECRSAGIAHRMGYGHRDIRGPWPLSALLSKAVQRAVLVEWEQIERIDGSRITLNVAADELRSVGTD
jgi:hypothetical protein